MLAIFRKRTQICQRNSINPVTKKHWAMSIPNTNSRTHTKWTEKVLTNYLYGNVIHRPYFVDLTNHIVRFQRFFAWNFSQAMKQKKTYQQSSPPVLIKYRSLCENRTFVTWAEWPTNFFPLAYGRTNQWLLATMFEVNLTVLEIHVLLALNLSRSHASEKQPGVSKRYTILQLNFVAVNTSMQQMLPYFASEDLYKCFETLFVYFWGLSEKWQQFIFQISF